MQIVRTGPDRYLYLHLLVEGVRNLFVTRCKYKGRSYPTLSLLCGFLPCTAVLGFPAIVTPLVLFAMVNIDQHSTANKIFYMTLLRKWYFMVF